MIKKENMMSNMDGMKHSMVKPTWVIPHPKENIAYIAGNGSDEVIEVNLDKWRFLIDLKLVKVLII